MAKDARIICEVPLASSAGRGSRIVASGDDDLFYVFRRTTSDTALLTPQQTFNMAGAEELAQKVLAGDPLASTAPETLRILAAAVSVNSAHRAHAVTPVAPADDGADKRGEDGAS